MLLNRNKNEGNPVELCMMTDHKHTYKSAVSHFCVLKSTNVVVVVVVMQIFEVEADMFHMKSVLVEIIYRDISQLYC
jgi:hypothetical protein